MPDESERGFDVRDVDGVRIRKQGQAAACREAFEKRFGEKRDRVEHTVPTLAEFFKAERQLKFFGEMFVPIPRRHPAFLPVIPARIGLERFPHLLRGKVVTLTKRFKRTGQVHVDNDSANIENDRSRSFADWAAQNRHG